MPTEHPDPWSRGAAAFNSLANAVKERMRGQLYVPSVSTIALLVAVASLTIAGLNGLAQRERWQAEDSLKDPYPQVAWSNELVQGKYRTLGFWTTNVLIN